MPSTPSSASSESNCLQDKALLPNDKSLPIKIPSVSVLGVPFHALTLKEGIQILLQAIETRARFQVCFANAYTVALSRQDAEFQRLLQNSFLVFADGMSIVWGARWIGKHVPERVTGPDIMTRLCEVAAERHYRVFLCGTSIQNLEQLQKILKKNCPDLIVAGHSPPIRENLSEEETLIILDELHRARPDILFVGMSCPKQEKWIAKNLHRIPVPVCLGVGAAFDFLSGNIPRAPRWMRERGLEWLYRLYREPRRLWKRYLLGNVVFLSLLALEMLRIRLPKVMSGENRQKSHD